MVDHVKGIFRRRKHPVCEIPDLLKLWCKLTFEEDLIYNLVGFVILIDSYDTKM